MPWNVEEFDLKDDINWDIWNDSPTLQVEIHTRTNNKNELRFDGSFGCQQAMLSVDGFDANPLPWVPDLVGKDFVEKGSLLIVGSAYAPFLAGFSRRNAILPNDYAAQETPGGFLANLFLPFVVDKDPNYYGRLEALLENVHPEFSRTVLTDLCRGSFVRRGRQRNRRDSGGDSVVRKCGSLFEEYAFHNFPMEWTWRRLNQGCLRNIVALGQVAEHGILRLFSHKECEIWEHETGIRFDDGDRQTHWVRRYAEKRFNLRYWIQQDRHRWWDVKKGKRKWRVFPVFHPSDAAYKSENDPAYESTIPRLRDFLNS